MLANVVFAQIVKMMKLAIVSLSMLVHVKVQAGRKGGSVYTGMYNCSYTFKIISSLNTYEKLCVLHF